MKTGIDIKRVEVFRTNVRNREQADGLIDLIQTTFANYKATFDLEDCDRVLVVKCTTGSVQSSLVIDLLKNFKYHAEVLPDV